MKKVIFGFITLIMLTNCSAFNVGLSGASFTGNDAIKVANAVKNGYMLSKDGVKEEVITNTKNIIRSIKNNGSFQR